MFWAVVCAVGLLLLGVWAPETKGVPMERMTELFDGPWYMGWNAKVDLNSDSDSAERVNSSDKQTINEKYDRKSSDA